MTVRSLACLAALLGGLIMPVAASADFDSEITSVSGVVTNETGTPLSDIKVALLGSSGGRWEESFASFTDADGRYRIAMSVDRGVSRISFSDPAGLYATEFWDESPDADGATAYYPGQSPTTIDETLAPASTISGRISNGLGMPVASRATAYVASPTTRSGWQAVADASADDLGTYELAGLGAGTYRVLFTGRGFQNEVWQDAAYVEEGESIVVGRDTDVTGIDATLSPPGHLRGRVSDAAGNALTQVNVTAHYFLDGRWRRQDPVAVDDQGRYEIGNLSAGRYRLQFRDVANRHLRETWWGGGVDLESADDISLPVGSDRDDLDVTLVRASSISGTVTDESGQPLMPWVTIDRVLPDRVDTNVGSYVGGPAGSYTVDDLVPGRYSITFRTNPDRVTEFWRDTVDPAAVTYIDLAEGEQLTGIDATLAPAAHIVGRITNGNFGDMYVRATRRGGGAQTFEVKTYGTDYDLGGLPPGEYFLYFGDHSGEYAGQHYTVNGEPAVVAVREGEIVSGPTPTLAERPPRNTVRPVIEHDLLRFRTISARPGQWTPVGVTFRYQWYRGQSPIPGASDQSYVLTQADTYSHLTVLVTGERPGQPPGRAASDPLYVAELPPGGGPTEPPTSTSDSRPSLSIRKPARISGVARVDRTVRVTGLRIAPRPASLRYRWFADGKRLRGEQSRKLRLRPRHLQHRISARVMAKRPGYAPAVSKRVRLRGRVRR